MEKDDLIKSASKLKQPSGEAIAEFTSRRFVMTRNLKWGNMSNRIS